QRGRKSFRGEHPQCCRDLPPARSLGPGVPDGLLWRAATETTFPQPAARRGLLKGETSMRPKGRAALLQWRRTRAVELLEQGECPALVARILGVVPNSLYRRRRMAQAGALESKPHPGPQKRLTDHDYEELEKLLLEGAAAHGWINTFWTAARVGEVIRKHFGVAYHPSHVSRILREHLSWTWQRPDSQHRDRDDDEIKWWVTNGLPKA